MAHISKHGHQRDTFFEHFSTFFIIFFRNHAWLLMKKKCNLVLGLGAGSHFNWCHSSSYYDTEMPTILNCSIFKTYHILYTWLISFRPVSGLDHTYSINNTQSPVPVTLTPSFTVSKVTLFDTPVLLAAGQSILCTPVTISVLRGK